MDPLQPTVEFILPHIDDAWRRLQDWLADLTDDEFNWRPTDNTWHLEERDGRWTIPYSWIPPEPAPFTTIGWRLAHLATSKALIVSHAFGDRRLRLADIDLPHSAAEMLIYLGKRHGEFVHVIANLTDADLAQPRWTEWGEQRTTAAIIGGEILHDVEHGAQIAAIRELFRHRYSGGHHG